MEESPSHGCAQDFTNNDKNLSGFHTHKKYKKFLFECAYCCLEFRSYRDPKMKSLKTVGN